jgi:hypothetical protein
MNQRRMQCAVGVGLALEPRNTNVGIIRLLMLLDEAV